MLYGYGGFNINVLPEFSVRRIVFMESFDGVAAIANIRGGGYGIQIEVLLSITLNFFVTFQRVWKCLARRRQSFK